MAGLLEASLHYDNVDEFLVKWWMQSFLLSGDSSGPGFQSVVVKEQAELNCTQCII